ncbi:MAG: MOP flippase family protein [Bryobacteraceae bacterium]
MSETPTESLGSKTARGAAWSAVSRTTQQLIQTASTAILARLLGPGDYGLVAMASVFVNLLQQIGDMGTGSAVVQRPELTPRLLSSIFWFNVALGLVAGGLLAAVSPLAALYYHEPQVSLILSVLALNFPLAGLGIVHQSLLVRNMEYRKLFIVEVVATLVSTSVGIGMAWSGAGPWSLVAASLALTASSASLYWLLSGWWPSLSASRADIRSIRSFTMNLTGFVLVNYFSRNAGHLIVGALLGKVMLGYYQMAYSLMIYPLQNINGVLGRVLFSAFARIQNQPERLRSAYARFLSVASLLNFPLMLGMMITAEPLIRVFLGPKWLPVAPLVTILAPIGLLQSVANPSGQIFLATGRTDLMLRVGVASMVIQVLSYVAGVPWGLQGVVISYGIGTLAVVYLCTAIPYRLIQLRVLDIATRLAPIALAAATMALAAFGWRVLMQSLIHANPVLVLFTTVLFGMALYAAFVLHLRPPVLADVLQPLENSRFLVARRFAARYGAPSDAESH